MKCKIIYDLLPVYIDDVCSDETKELVEQHLSTCPDCRKEYEKMKAELTMNKVEDMNEKELMERGKETMKEHVEEKLYRKLIFGDTILNFLLGFCLFAYEWNGLVTGEDTAYMSIGLFGGFLGIWLVSDIIYWVMYIRRRIDDTIIINAMCKWSIWLKVITLIGAVVIAAAVGFYMLLNGGKI